MKNNLFYDFSVNKETNTITVKREFAATLPLVWDAWTKPEIIDRWWAPKGWESITKSLEFEEGGRRFYVMRGEGNEFWGIATYDSIAMHKNFSGKDCFADEQGNINPEHPQSNYKIIFVNKGDKTYIMHTSIYPDLAQLEASIEYGFESGMMMAFEGLDKELALLSE